MPSRAKLALCRFSGWCSMNFDTSTLASRFGPAKPRGIGWDGAGVSVTASQSRHVIFSRTCSTTFQRRGSHSSVRDTVSPSLRRRSPPHLVQAQGAGYTTRSTGKVSGRAGRGDRRHPALTRYRGHTGGGDLGLGFGGGLTLLQVSNRQFKLLDEELAALGRRPVLVPAQLGEEELELLVLETAHQGLAPFHHQGVAQPQIIA